VMTPRCDTLCWREGEREGREDGDRDREESGGVGRGGEALPTHT